MRVPEVHRSGPASWTRLRFMDPFEFRDAGLFSLESRVPIPFLVRRASQWMRFPFPLRDEGVSEPAFDAGPFRHNMIRETRFNPDDFASLDLVIAAFRAVVRQELPCAFKCCPLD